MTAPATPTLQLSDVKEAAEEEYFDVVHESATPSSTVSFKKYDAVFMLYFRINVWCAQSVVGISIDHPLLGGKNQAFVSGVSKSDLAEIFRSPYSFAGYEDLDEERKAQAPPLMVGVDVEVQGFGNKGYAKVVAEPNEKGLWKVRR